MIVVDTNVLAYLAMQFNTKLVTADKKLLRAFPACTQALDDFCL